MPLTRSDNPPLLSKLLDIFGKYIFIETKDLKPILAEAVSSSERTTTEEQIEFAKSKIAFNGNLFGIIECCLAIWGSAFEEKFKTLPVAHLFTDSRAYKHIVLCSELHKIQHTGCQAAAKFLLKDFNHRFCGDTGFQLTPPWRINPATTTEQPAAVTATATPTKLPATTRFPPSIKEQHRAAKRKRATEQTQEQNQATLNAEASLDNPPATAKLCLFFGTGLP